ncbi:hypothetical protein BCR35DRAFT_337414 [Leucosporidium creatinivorum]|uniref:Sulphur transport domain-containing protein n=1 Tax=Leucosporidium creatinivorum TaxID=106004 RepID=A0A1Y2FWW4_9BASI|nr:hypothetical protein BCR35DRAFT_337414 [Leucosporidium creatinivorum]
MPFTPLPSLIGGLMLSASTSSLLAGQGRVLGVSGIAHSVLASLIARTAPEDREKKLLTGAPAPRWKAAAFGGMLAGGVLLRLLEGRLGAFVGGSVFDGPVVGLGMGRVLLAGLFVGLGTKLGSGCTSGHMLCGLSRFSPRSLIATLTFFSVALVTAQLLPASLPPPTTTMSTTPTLSLPTLALLQLPFLIYTLTPFLLPPAPAELLTSFFTSLHFTFGLALAGMTSPSKVLSFFYLPLPFLPLAGDGGRSWDPSLAMVALGGLLPNVLAWRRIKGWSRPMWRENWELPNRRDVDWKLVTGSAMFGVGWGLLGICPGPLLANLGAGNSLDVVGPFLGAFATGGLLGGML